MALHSIMMALLMHGLAWAHGKGEDAEDAKLIIKALLAAKVWLLGECECEV